jgi:pimeloyl-ACP methyl ester carboxylesterase
MMPPLLLLPGLLCNELLWEPQVRGLGEHTQIQVADLTRGESIAEMASHALAQAPWPAFAVAGLSMGGYVAMEVMRRAPERIAKLALLDTSARPETPAATERRMHHIALAERDIELAAREFFPLLVHPDRAEDDTLLERLLTMARAVGKEAFIRQQHAIMGRADSRAWLAAIACPTLVLCGRQDVLCTVAMHEEIADRIPIARLVIIENCGHLPTWEEPEATNSALRVWLAE